MHTDLSSLMTDIVTFIVAVGFGVLGRATYQRVYHSQSNDSV